MELRSILFAVIGLLFSCTTGNTKQIPNVGYKKYPGKHFELTDTIVYRQINARERQDDRFLYNCFSAELQFNVEKQASSLIIKTENQNIQKYELQDNFDSGEFNLWLYSNENDYIYLLELDDYYVSVFYVYYHSKENLIRIGDFLLEQADVEEVGVKKKSFKVKRKGSSITIDSYLDDSLVNSKRFKINGNDLNALLLE